ncbi:MAG TPA: hypothetical protein VI007_02270 [bacterium]
MNRPQGTIGLRHVVAGVLLLLLLLEGVLRLVQAAVVTPPQILPADNVGWRPNPAYPEHDTRGWRNAAPLREAEIVILGDSQTYGFNVVRKDAWPQQLSVMLDRSVYQMAAPGYGPAHYVPLLEEALALRPKVVIAAYYFGNDIYDSYSIVYGVDTVRTNGGVLDLFLSTDSRIRAALARAEILDPKLLRLQYLACNQAPAPGLDATQMMRGSLTRRERLQPPGGQGALWRRPIRSITRHSAIVKALRWGLARLVTNHRPPLEVKDYGPPLCIHYHDHQLRTVFAAGYRLIALDDADPRIQEGERISLDALRYMAVRCRGMGIHFLVALIPTKETAFRARVEGTLREQLVLQDLWKAEARARERTLTFFAHAGIGTADTLPDLADVIASGVNPYRDDDDGHPITPGYEAIARAVAQRLAPEGVGHH